MKKLIKNAGTPASRERRKRTRWYNVQQRTNRFPLRHAQRNSRMMRANGYQF